MTKRTRAIGVINPVTICISTLAMIYLLLGLWTGAPVASVIQHIVAPYTVDIPRGLGHQLAPIFSILVALMQLLVLLFAVLMIIIPQPLARMLIATLGVFFTLAYFVSVALAFIAPRFH